MKQFTTIMLGIFLSIALPVVAQDVVPERADTLDDGVNVVFDSLAMDSIVPDTVKKEVLVDKTTWEYKLRERMKPLEAEARKSRYTTSICVWDLEGDSVVYAYNPQKRMRPASTEKLLTAITALDMFGKKGEFTTSAYMDGKISHDQVMRITERNYMETHWSETLEDSIQTEIVVLDTTYFYQDVLHGNIYIKGGFDPLFSTDDLHDMAKAIGRLDFEDIDGLVIGDISMKDSLVFGKGWSWDDMPSSYVPWLSPLLFNEGIRLTNRSGIYMKNPDKYFLDNLISQLRERGKEIPASYAVLSFNKTPAEQGRLIYSCTHTIGDMLERMMKKSNNQFAEALFYLIGYNNGELDRPATAEDCAAHIMQLMEKAGCTNLTDTSIADGSGLSPYNYVSAENEVMMLRYAYLNKHIYDPLYKSLPIAGVDGTLSTRMKSGAAYKKVHAKTGTLNGVATLAGYMKASNGNMLAFSIMNNGIPSNATGRNFQDRVCQALAK